MLNRRQFYDVHIGLAVNRPVASILGGFVEPISFFFSTLKTLIYPQTVQS